MDQRTQPKISILMCVYNEEKFINDAIDSVLSQSYKNFQLIIINDGSNDKTQDIIQEYSNDKRVQSYNPGRIGKIKANNLAFSKSDGEFLCYFSGDDLLEPYSLEKRIEPIINIFDKPAISLCRLKTFSNNKKHNGIIIPRDSNRGNSTSGCQIFNRKFANLVFPIPDFLGNEDMWPIQYANYYPGVITKHISEIGLKYRIHSNNSSSKVDSFNKKTEAMHKRFIVYKVFLDKNKELLNQDSIEKLKSLSLAEDLRYRQKSLSILLVNNLSFSEKLRFFFYSNRLLYIIRKKMFSLFSGW